MFDIQEKSNSEGNEIEEANKKTDESGVDQDIRETEKEDGTDIPIPDLPSTQEIVKLDNAAGTTDLRIERKGQL